MSDSPYIVQELGDSGPLNIFIVDGQAIRRDLDEEFTNYGHSLVFSFIPEGEIWIDENVDQEEIQFLKTQAYLEIMLSREGIPFEDTQDISSEMMLDSEDGKDSPADKIKLDKIGNMAGLEVYRVDGQVIRSQLDPNFVHGGHSYRYDFIPIMEIWIDKDIEEEEIPYILMHEVFERNLMQSGLDYESAHFMASNVEKEYRNQS